MFAALPALWTGFTGWVSKNPIVMWIGAALAVLLGWEFVKRSLKEAGRQAERLAQAKRNAEEMARVTETRRVIEETRTHDILTAEQAGRDLPRFDSVDQLREQRPDLYRLLFGDSAGGSGETEGR